MRHFHIAGITVVDSNVKKERGKSMAHAFSPSWHRRHETASQFTVERNVVATIHIVVDQVARKAERSSCGNNHLQLNILSVPRPLEGSIPFTCYQVGLRIKMRNNWENIWYSKQIPVKKNKPKLEEDKGWWPNDKVKSKY